MTFSAGQTLTAAGLNAAIAGVATLKARQTAQVDKTNNTFADLTGLSVQVEANKTYRVQGRLLVTGANTTHDVKFQLSMPSGATVQWSVYGGDTSITANPMSINLGSTSGSHARGTTASTLAMPFEGVITVAGTAGTVQMQGAQNTTDPGTLSFLVGSVMELEEWV